MYECADALSFIHSKDHLHNDLKGDNVIISDVNNSLRPVIIDFGKSTTLAKGKFYKLSLSGYLSNKIGKNDIAQSVSGEAINLCFICLTY